MILKKSLCCTCAVFLIILCCDSSAAQKLPQRNTTEHGKCAPLNIVNGDYIVLGRGHKKGRPIPNYAIVNISCNSNFGLYPNNSVNVCINGNWSNQPLQECRQFCSPRISTSVKVTCTLDGRDVDCTKPVVDGTVAHSTCNRFYYQPYGGFPISKCSGGSWDIPLIICESECGQLIPTGGTNVVGGHDAERGKFPWHIGLYRFNASKSTYNYKCGGSIISHLLVITVAHCVANYNAEEFYVAAGKYYSNYDAPEDNLAQKRQVKEYKIPREYRGYHTHHEADLAVLVLKQAFTLSNVVQPVCVDWNSDYEEQQLRPQTLGNVVGWGFTDPGKFQVSKTLKQLTVPYIDRQDCLDAVPQEFQRWVTHDKFCAGWTNGSSVCKGDSGGGLVFKWTDNNARNKIKYYIRGLVSVGPLKGRQCDNYKYGVYTKISSHIQFIRQVVLNFKDGACAPLNIVNGDYKVLGTGYVKGTHIPNFAMVNISCNANYTLYPSDPVNTCINGEWNNQPLQECRQLCPPRISTSVKVTCTLDGSDVDCTKPVVDGTVAESRCNHFYYQSFDDIPTSKCSEGSWDKPLIRCEPECGQRIHSRRKRVIGGHDAVRGEFPWHIGLYRFNAAKSTYDYQCGGSIISPLIVITAAHCVTNYKNKKYPAVEFYVAAGKYHSNYDAPEDSPTFVQKSQVKEYHIPPEYNAYYRNYEGDLAVLVIKQAFTLSNVVQPVCVDWNSTTEEQQLRPQKLGNVVGWGFTDPDKFKVSETLKQLTVPYIDRQNCLDVVTVEFQRYVTHDKFCAGWTNGSSVCKGDGGGGLVFESVDNNARNKIKYYLRGSVSVGPLKENQCDNYKYGVFTKISSYIQFIRQVVSENKVT